MIDDDASIRRIIQRLFETCGWDVTAADCVEQAKACLKARPTLAVVDLNLGKETGWDLVRVAAGAGIAVVVITGGEVDDDTRADATLLGARAMLGKPFTEREFWAAVARALLRTI